jgi:hypothetical protein
MHIRLFRSGVLLAGALASTLSLAAQQQAPSAQGLSGPVKKMSFFTEANAAVLANFERCQVAETGTPAFWFKGGSIDAALVFRHGLGVAVNFTGEHGKDLAYGVTPSKTAFMGGPRYTHSVSKRGEVFGEALFGGAHAFDSVFPAAGGARTAANSFSMQAGGGVDIGVAHGFGVRALEVDWVRTNLPNNAYDSQNDLRIAFGLSYRH